MKILHTSDWHLGQKLLSNDRFEEHQLALDWLIDLIEKEAIEILIISGDIFDVYNPPNYAREQYFRFLKKMVATCCQHIIITAGNHDSPSMLGASREVLQLLDIQVVVGVKEDVKDEIIEIKNGKNELVGIVAAIPFLRDEDIRKSVAGQTDLERSEQVKKAIYDHYQAVGKAVEKYARKNIPLIATGHLYAKGAEASGKQDNIYIGNIENIEAEQFPTVFDYIALGHIHRSQKVGGIEKIRYCGSLIPLSFSETKDEKGVLILDFEGKKLKEINTVLVPIFRRLKTIEGTIEEVKESLINFAQKERTMKPWVEIVIHTEQPILNLHTDLQEFTSEMNLELLKISVKRKHLTLEEQIEEIDLMSVDHFEVFEKKCASNGTQPEEMNELRGTYRELSEKLEDILSED